LGRLTWQPATVVALRDETRTARTLALDVAGWPGHDAGQHVDVRLTAPDGYSAVRSYSIASAVMATRIELTVEQVPDGEVSSYLTGPVSVGDRLEVRGPLGGWFVWRPLQAEPTQLIAGGSGMVPLMAMLRTRSLSHSAVPFRLLYSVRNPDSVLYGAELKRRSVEDAGFTLDFAYTRAVPDGWPRTSGRIDAALLTETTFAPTLAPTCYVCGPTPFVESVAGLLIAAGHDASRIKTERFGPTGGPA